MHYYIYVYIFVYKSASYLKLFISLKNRDNVWERKTSE